VQVNHDHEFVLLELVRDFRDDIGWYAWTGPNFHHSKCVLSGEFEGQLRRNVCLGDTCRADQAFVSGYERDGRDAWLLALRSGRNSNGDKRDE